MAVTYGFYDSLNHDRLYNAKQMSAIFDGIINDGVFDSVGNQLHTVAGSGMQVIVKSGRAWFNSTWTLNDAEYPLTIDAADVLLTRIDAVVIEVNSEQATRANSIKVVKGTPASSPAKPTLTNTSTVHQHALAYVTVAKNTTAITNSMIEIVVGKTETPYVTAILQTTDITDLYNQWEDYFQTWFDTVRGTLDGDVALNLQNQITTLERSILKSDTKTAMGLSSDAVGDDAFSILSHRFNKLKMIYLTTSQTISVPQNILSNTMKVICIGGGGGGGSGYYGGSRAYGQAGGGGGGGGYISSSIITVTPGERLVCIVGAGGTGGKGMNGVNGTTGGSTYIKRINGSDNLIIAEGGGGGFGATSTIGGKGGTGSSGGGGGSSFASSSTSGATGGNGGNGEYYGGGGGGSANSTGSYYKYTHSGNGGNGGKYGGGGGGGGYLGSSNNPDNDSIYAGTGGSGGTYGGKGGNGIIPTSESSDIYGDPGTVDLDPGLGAISYGTLIFDNIFSANGGSIDYHYTGSGYGCSGGTGGGGFGSNGGNLFSKNSGSVTGGAGGGGYHANGGDNVGHYVSGTSMAVNAGSGGGGYGGKGGSGGYFGGGGGGGYFASGGHGLSDSNDDITYDDQLGKTPGGGGGGGGSAVNTSTNYGGNGGSGGIYLFYYVGGDNDVF